MNVSIAKRIMIGLFDYVGPKMSKAEYKGYKKLLTQAQNTFNKNAAAKFTFAPTANRIANLYGGASAETLSTLRSSDFIDAVLKKLKSKGYKIPSEALSCDGLIPFWSGIGACEAGKTMIFSPRSINRLDPRSIFHEIGHLLHTKLQKTNGYIYNFLCWKDKHIPFLSKDELAVFMQDMARATREGYFRGRPFKYWLQDKNFAFGQIKNKAIRRFRKHAAEGNSRYSLTNRFEFVAEMFSLKVQGFKLSPEIEAIYQKFGGPAVTEVLSKEEVDGLIKLQKQIRKKTLSDYGVSVVS